MAKPFTIVSPEPHTSHISTNVNGFFHMTQCSLEFMSSKDAATYHDNNTLVISL